MTLKILVLEFKINSSQKIGQKLDLKDTYLASDNNFLRLNKLGLEKKSSLIGGVLVRKRGRNWTL